MSDECEMCLLGLILLCVLLTGTSEMDDTHVFFGSGEDACLPCNNALSNCTSTTWIYDRDSGTVELITSGIKRNDTKIHERLSLGSDCSLNIKNITKDDSRSYTCRQYVNGVQEGTDARVYLHVLHVSSSSSQSEIRSGRSLTLLCQLYYDPVSCDTLIREGLHLIWVDETGMNLTDSRFQISFSSGQCLSVSLSTTLLNEDHNREWRCELKQRDQLKTSVSYTIKYSVSRSTSTTAPSKTKTPSPLSRSTSTTAPTQSGMNRAEDVFFGSGEDVRLPCNNVLSNCTSTTWIYNRDSVEQYNRDSVELITLGIKRKYTEIHERLSLGSDCSLNIKNITKEDPRSYTCRQYLNGVQKGTDARVYLHVLHVSSSSSQSEIRSGRSLTLFCQLYYDPVSCDTLIREGLHLIWVDETGMNLTDSRFQISFSSGQCLSVSLSTTLLNEDHNREWRCELKQRDQLKTSVSYTVKYSGTQDSDRTPFSIKLVIGIGVAAALLPLAVIFWVICKKRAGKKNETSDSVGRSTRITPSTDEDKDEVTYVDVTHSTTHARKNKVPEDDKVTYSTIGKSTAGPQEDCSQLYASVNKNHHK
ncbi:uncharacterized protein LOC122349161 isoform X1 [Puntigrus tetrazona]|uniref:uncharacterized protein LOC122349161 isoform X1 n=1 Tax=Puntigrus tetrazona TaxID=1606681 RepID=UPI001C892870|nr:uncharacterized protein LOC122349161 isoform X1 [Puntigrus tetrazona]